jgi:hypothetical protein
LKPLTAIRVALSMIQSYLAGSVLFALTQLAYSRQRCRFSNVTQLIWFGELRVRTLGYLLISSVSNFGGSES